MVTNIGGYLTAGSGEPYPSVPCACQLRAGSMPELSTGTYTYSPLDDKSEEMRLLLLYPHAPDDYAQDSLICAEPVQTALQHKPTYVGLSYVWGDPEKTTPISAGGSMVQITET